MNNHDLKFYILMFVVAVLYMAWINHQLTIETLEFLGK